jgi:hypothetical protein
MGINYAIIHLVDLAHKIDQIIIYIYIIMQGKVA